ncbi:MAG: hypothetical protein WA414_02765 [Acidobacteriaceae bacterium]
MGGVVTGLAVFCGLLWAVAAYNRYQEAIENAAVRAEQEKQQKRWEEEYLKAQDSSVQQPHLA